MLWRVGKVVLLRTAKQAVERLQGVRKAPAWKPWDQLKAGGKIFVFIIELQVHTPDPKEGCCPWTYENLREVYFRSLLKEETEAGHLQSDLRPRGGMQVMTCLFTLFYKSKKSYMMIFFCFVLILAVLTVTTLTMRDCELFFFKHDETIIQCKPKNTYFQVVSFLFLSCLQ